MKRQISWVGWFPLYAVAAIITSVYIAWFAAYSQLGRRPMPSMDDPKFIGGVSTAVYDAVGWVILAALVMWVVGMITNFVMSLLPRTENRNVWVLKFTSGLATIALLLLMIRYSPGGACNWFLD